LVNLTTQRLREAEAAKWKVDEAAAAEEVARLKKEFIERNKPKSTPLHPPFFCFRSRSSHGGHVEPAKEVLATSVTPIVIDVGSNTIKAGFGGDDAPLFVFSAVVGRVQK
jgi:hypothetical protein